MSFGMSKQKHTLKGLSKGYMVSNVILEIYMVKLWKIQSKCFLYISPDRTTDTVKSLLPFVVEKLNWVFAQFIVEESFLYIYYQRNVKFCVVFLV